MTENGKKKKASMISIAGNGTVSIHIVGKNPQECNKALQGVGSTRQSKKMLSSVAPRDTPKYTTTCRTNISENELKTSKTDPTQLRVQLL